MERISNDFDRDNILNVSSRIDSISVRKTDIPAYLRSGEFYKTLDGEHEEQDQQITIPSNTLKLDSEIKNNKDLHHILISLRFWGVDHICEDVIKFCLETSPQCDEILNDFKNDFTYISVLVSVLNTRKEHQMLVAVQSGLLEIVQNLPSDLLFEVDCCRSAAKAGNLAILQCLQARGGLLDGSVLDAALRGGKGLACMQYLRAQGVDWQRTSLSIALQSRSFDCVLYALQYGCTWEKHGYAYFNEGDKHTDLLQFALHHGFEPGRLDACVAAACGAIQCLQLLHGANCPWDEAACQQAAHFGHLECLQYLHESGCPWDLDACAEAAGSGHLHCLKYLHEQGCPWNYEAFEEAATHGRVDCIRYLHENSCAWNTDVTTQAASSGQLQCLQYLHEQGCPWDDGAIYRAIERNQTECVQYALQHGCPVPSDACAQAAQLGQLQILQALHKASAPWNSQTCAEAAKNGHLACLQYAHENGCAWDKNVCSDAAGKGYLECLRYAHEQGRPLNKNVALYSAANGHLDCLQYAHEHGAPWDKMTFRETVRNGQLECLKYLVENGCPVDEKACRAAVVNPRNAGYIEYLRANFPQFFEK